MFTWVNILRTIPKNIIQKVKMRKTCPFSIIGMSKTNSMTIFMRDMSYMVWPYDNIRIPHGFYCNYKSVVVMKIVPPPCAVVRIMRWLSENMC